MGNMLKFEDSNTKFFQLSASQSKKTNRITQMIRPQGELISYPNQLGTLFSNYYSQLFTSSNLHFIDECLIDLPQCITTDMNNSLYIFY